MTTAGYKRPLILSRPEMQKGHVVIEASAGTGKTYTLEHLVLDLVITGQALIEQILVVTFTDAATHELRERIRNLIQTVFDCSEEIPPTADSRDYWLVDEESRTRLREALFRFDGASISTIHGFCHGILTEQAFLGGRLFEQVHADGREVFGQAFREELRVALADQGVVGEALRDWIRAEKKIGDLEDFLFKCHREGSPERCPVTPRWEPAELKKACAGLPDLEALKKAGREIYSDGRAQKSFNSILDGLFDLISLFTADSDLFAAASEFLEWANKERTLNTIKETVIEHLYQAGSKEQAPAELKELTTTLRKIETRCLNPESFMVYKFLPQVRKRLNLRKKALGLLDYDDMLLGVLDALQGKDSAVLKAALRRRWTHALVDEFQDTDPVQWEIFRQIFVDGAEGHRLFLIGDPKQAIYGFRGADLHTYDLARCYLLKEKDAARLPLTENFRSTGLMIEALNQIFQSETAAGHGFFTGLNRYSDPVECGDKTREAFEAGKMAAPVHVLPLYVTGGKLNATRIKEGVACFMAGEILRLTDDQTGLKTKSGGSELRPIRFSDIFILTRTTREGLAIGRILRNYGIPHAYYKQDGLYQTDEAVDVYNLLAAIGAPDDQAIRMAAWLTPFFGLTLSELPAWQQARNNHPLFSILLKWKQLADTQQWSQLFDSILTSSGIARRLIFFGNERALTNYLHLFELLQAEAHKKPVTLRELARDLKAKTEGKNLTEGREGNVQRLESDKEAVQILTMHKAKGLEAEVIFIGGGFGNTGGRGIKTAIYHVGSERRLHIGKAAGEIANAVKTEEEQENERLFYVALTRARSRLYLPFFGLPQLEIPAQEKRNYDYSHLGAMYGKLQQQLNLLSQLGCFEEPRLYRIRPLSCSWEPQYRSSRLDELPDWQPKKVLELPSSTKEEAEKITSEHRGVLLTSFTRIKKAETFHLTADGSENDSLLIGEEVSAEVSTEKLQPAEQELPGGRDTGIFLHALLENIPETELSDTSYSDWAAMEIVMLRAEKLARRYGFNFEHLPAALKLAFKALTSPINLASREKSAVLEMPDGLVSGENVRKEMPFAYPIPEVDHLLLSNSAVTGQSGESLPFEVGRGYLQGLIDYVFEYNGRVYLLDWKSDRLADFGPESVDLHVRNNYSLQAGIYTLATVRLLGIQNEADYNSRFGGVLYIFIRGLTEYAKSSDGIWFSCPGWSNLLKFERNLLARNQWGGAVIT
jgi:exodeoxyribonuclease V beta subunit